MRTAAATGMKAAHVVAAAMIVTLGLAPTWALAGPEGSYDMTGTNPEDGTPYQGAIEVTKTGETYAVIWRFGTDETHGIGALTRQSDKTFAVSYGAGESHGIALYELQGDGSWSGTWANMTGQTLGTEIWRPKGSLATRGGESGSGSVPTNASTPQSQGAAQR